MKIETEVKETRNRAFRGRGKGGRGGRTKPRQSKTAGTVNTENMKVGTLDISFGVVGGLKQSVEMLRHRFDTQQHQAASLGESSTTVLKGALHATLESTATLIAQSYRTVQDKNFLDACDAYVLSVGREIRSAQSRLPTDQQIPAFNEVVESKRLHSNSVPPPEQSQ
eukprot:Rmarinus@m.15190